MMVATLNDDSVDDGGGDVTVMLVTVILAFQHASLQLNIRVYFMTPLSQESSKSTAPYLPQLPLFGTSCLILPPPIDSMCSAAVPLPSAFAQVLDCRKRSVVP
jgi:hypothetical protein